MSRMPTFNAESILLGLPAAFLTLKPESRQFLAREARLASLARGELFVEVGQPRPPVFVVRSGLLSVALAAMETTRTVADFLVAQDVYTTALAPNGVSAYEIRSVGNSALVCWPEEVMTRVMMDNPSFQNWLVQYMIHRESKFRTRHARISNMPLEAQLAYFFWSVSEASRDGMHRILSVKIPQQLLASYFDVTREEISRKKQLLEKAGYLMSTPEGILLSPRLTVVFSMQSDTPAPWEHPWPRALVHRPVAWAR